MKTGLDSARLAELRNVLLARATTLRDEVRSDLLKTDDERARLLADRVNDLEDDAVVDLVVDLDLAEIDRDLGEWRAVEAALARLRQGSYGTCADCGAEIPFARLRAQPTAVRCVTCAARHERTHAGTSTPRL
jgi:RNA polymerase-binding protein DksA